MIHFELTFADGARNKPKGFFDGDIWTSNCSSTMCKIDHAFFTELTLNSNWKSFVIVCMVFFIPGLICLLIYFLIFPLISHHTWYCNFHSKSSNQLVLVFQLCSFSNLFWLSHSQSFVFSYKLFNLLMNFYKKFAEILIGINLGKNDILRIQKLPIHTQGIALMFWIFFDFSQKCFVIFSTWIFQIYFMFLMLL